MEYALSMVDNLSGPANNAAASMRGLHEELTGAKTELAALEAAQKTLASGDSVDIEAYRKLNAQIDAAKKKVIGLQTEISKQGGAAFNVAKYDKQQADQKAKLDKAQATRSEQLSKGAERNTQAIGMAGKAVGFAIAGAMAVGAVAVKGFSFIWEKALASQAQSQARLNAIQARFNQGLLDIGKKANLKPLLDGADRLAAMFGKNTATGQFMGQQVQRAFDLIGKAATAIVPYAEKAFAKTLIASIKAETGFYNLVTAAAKVGKGIADAITGTPGSLDTITSAAKSVKAAFDELDKAGTSIGQAFSAIAGNSTATGLIFSIMAAQVRTLVIVFGSVAKVISGVGTVIGGVGKIISGVFSGDATKAIQGFGDIFVGVIQASSVAALGPLKLVANVIDAITMSKLDLSGKVSSLEKSMDAMVKKGFEPLTKAGTGTKEVGNQIGDGLIKGLDDKQGPIYEAGKKAAEEAIKGAKAGAEVASPSKKMRREVGFMMAAGVALGLLDGAPMVYDAAQDSLVPEVEVAANDNGSGSTSAPSNNPLAGAKRVVIIQPGAFVSNNPAELEVTMRRILREESDEILDSLGVEVSV